MAKKRTQKDIRKAEEQFQSWRGKVLEFVQRCGKKGCIQRDALSALGGPYSTVTTRFSELVRQGAIVETALTRPLPDTGDHARVYVAREHLKAFREANAKKRKARTA